MRRLLLPLLMLVASEIHLPASTITSISVYNYLPKPIPCPSDGTECTDANGGILAFDGPDTNYVPVFGTYTKLTVLFAVPVEGFSFVVDTPLNIQWNGSALANYAINVLRSGTVLATTKATFPIQGTTGIFLSDYQTFDTVQLQFSRPTSITPLYNWQYSNDVTPEPSTLLLFVTGAVITGVYLWLRRRVSRAARVGGSPF